MSGESRWTAENVVGLLRARYAGNDWAFVADVPNGTGANCNRRCDGLAMSLWPSKGLYLHGHEIKVARSDWLKEIQDVAKAAAFSVFCHYWWIVAPSGIVKLEELPSDWGLMCPTGGGSLRVKRPATLTEPALPDHSLLAGIFRACVKASICESAMKKEWSNGYHSGIKEANSLHEQNEHARVRQSDRRYETLKRSVDDFESASGIAITEFSGRRIGAIVKLIDGVSLGNIRSWLEGVETRLADVTRRVSEARLEMMDQVIE